jgi:hypothetical protein
MAILRTIIDIEVSDAITRGDATKYAEQVKDYAAVIAGPELTEKTTAEINPDHSYHVHDGESSCRSCRRAAEDGKS